MIQRDLFTVAEKGTQGPNRYNHVKPIALEIRRTNPTITPNRILEALKAMNVAPLPAISTIGRWCRSAGMPIFRALAFSQYPDEFKERILKLLESGMSKKGVMALLESEGADVPPYGWIDKIWRAHRRGGLVLLKNANPVRQVENLLHEGVIEMGEAWEALIQRGMDEDAALEWVMARFYGGDAKIEKPANTRGRVFSISQQRWAA